MEPSKYLYPPVAAISREDRNRLNGHPGGVLWLTGLSGAGKSTLAAALEAELYRREVRTYVLDGDALRRGINSDLDFSAAGRKENIRRIGEVARMFAEAGLVTIVAAISPYRADRQEVRTWFAGERFYEVYVKCGIDTCAARDPKGLYAKARQGLIANFTGVSMPYEEPLSPEVVIETDVEPVERSRDRLIQFLVTRGMLPRAREGNG